MGKKFEKIIKLLYDIWQGILEIIYPRENYCIICKKDDCFGICKSCKNSIKIINKTDTQENINLKNINHTEINSYGYYGGVLKKLILKLKYEKNFTAGDILAELLEEYIIKNFNYEKYVITYIPLSKKSKKKRGFNQCEYIAKKISYDLGIKNLEILKKDKETKEQKRLKKNERFENIKDAFIINKKNELRNKNILLIDDVTTTGATMIEAYKILKKYGVNEIKLLTLAKSHI